MLTHLKHRTLPLALLAMLAAMAVSCEVGPDYKRPEVESPDGFKSATTQETATPQIRRDWWKVFNDDRLDELMTAAIHANTDVRAAMARVQQSRAVARIAKADFYPIITLDPSFEVGRFSGSGGNVGNVASSDHATRLSVPFDLTYEVDVWGRVRRAFDSARARAQATENDLGVVLLTLEADVAQDYFTIRSLDSQDEILKRNVEDYRQQLVLTNTKFDAGLAGKTDVRQAEALLYATVAQEIDIRRQRADLEHALATLLGRSPSRLTVATQPLVDVDPPTIPAGLPADLLRRRPDVAEAEQNLVAANADIGAAVAQLYPTIRLVGTAGLENIDVQNSISWESRVWSIGPSVTVPIFEGGRLRANVAQTRARYDELLATYQGTVLTAIRDVEDSLTDLHHRADQADAQQAAVDASREYYQRSQNLYKLGLVSYLQVIDAERTLLNNELLEAQILNNRMASTVLLVKALGGGWHVEDDQRRASSR